MGGSPPNPSSLWVLHSEGKELVMSVIPRACLCAVFSFMFPLVILDGIQSTEATLQLCLRHPSARSHCSGCNHFARLCGWICLDPEQVPSALPLNVHVQGGREGNRQERGFLLLPLSKEMAALQPVFFTEQPHRHKALFSMTWRVLCLARDFPHQCSY